MSIMSVLQRIFPDPDAPSPVAVPTAKIGNLNEYQRRMLAILQWQQAGVRSFFQCTHDLFDAYGLVRVLDYPVADKVVCSKPVGRESVFLTVGWKLKNSNILLMEASGCDCSGPADGMMPDDFADHLRVPVGSNAAHVYKFSMATFDGDVKNDRVDVFAYKGVTGAMLPVWVVECLKTLG
jgi:hypothetical protein